MAATADLVVRVITDTTKAASGLDAVSSSTGRMAAGVKRAALPAAAALAGLAAAAFSAGTAAADDAKAAAILATNLKNTTGATDAQIAATEEYIDKMAKATGVADDQLRPALANLARGSGDVTQAQKDLATVLDVAAATGSDVETVSKAVAKAYGGSTTSLKKLIPSLDEATLAGGDMSAIMADLAGQTGGAAAAAADTAAGKMARMQVAMDEAKEEIGSALLPVLSSLATMLGKVAGWAQEHPALFRAIAIAVAALAAAILIANVAFAILNIVAAPVVLIVLAIVAAVALLVAGIVLLWKKSEEFRAVATAVWDAIKFAASAYWEYVKTVAGIVFGLLKAGWKALEPIVTAVWDAIKTAAGIAFDWIKDKWDRWAPIIKAGFADLKEKGEAAWNAIKDAVGPVIDKVKDFYNNYLQPVVTFAGNHKDDIAAMFTAALGPIGTLITKVQELNSWLDKVSAKGSAIKAAGPPGGSTQSAPAPRVAGPTVGGYAAPVVGTRSASSGVTGSPLVINVTGALDPEAVARQIRRVLAGHDRRMGLTA